MKIEDMDAAKLAKETCELCEKLADMAVQESSHPLQAATAVAAVFTLLAHDAPQEVKVALVENVIKALFGQDSCEIVRCDSRSQVDAAKDAAQAAGAANVIRLNKRTIH